MKKKNSSKNMANTQFVSQLLALIGTENEEKLFWSIFKKYDDCHFLNAIV